MESAVNVLTVVLPLLYALAAGWSIYVFVTRAPVAVRRCRVVLGLTVGVHVLTFVLRAAAERRCPLGAVSETLGLMAFALVSLYLFLGIRSGTRPTGVLVLPMAFALELLSALLRNPDAEPIAALSNPWFNIHAAAAVFGVAALAVSFVHGVFYLLLYRQIRDHRFGMLFRRLPPLAVLTKKAHAAAVVGWALLLVTIVAGSIRAMTDEAIGSLHRDPLFLITVGTWVLYSIGLGVRYLAGWRGRYTIYVPICGFVLLMVSLVVVSFLGMHGAR